MFTYKGFLLDPYQGLTTLRSKSIGHKWIQNLLKPYKYPPNLEQKEVERGDEKRKRKDKKRKRNINKNTQM